jgi:phage I-like protein
MRINGTSAYSAIKLAEGQKVPNEVQVLRVGKFNHPKYGAFEITPLTLAEMKANFDSKIRGVDMSFDYYHDSDKDASAWVYNLELREGGTELWAVEVEWTPKAEQKLSEKELRYFSPDFAFKWKDPEKGVEHKNVLFGGGLTNRPFVKEMKAIVADETQGENMTDLEKALAKIKEVEAANLKLSEDKAVMEKKMADMVPAGGDSEPAEVTALKKQIADLQAQLSKAQGDAEVALAEKKKADDAAKIAGDAKVLAEKEGAFNLLLSEGKACAAQKPAFLKGDMTEFVKLAQPVNMRASGSSESVTLAEDDVAAVIKLAEEKQKANPKLNRGDAISLAKRELKK